MIKVGMMIADRYEIIEKIGTGGMSDVYRAKCHKLNRFVAVKVLKQEFSENKDFVSKFRVEAQAAAGLMHPNIVNVYDVGEESGMHYIVMELVEGITLKKYIEKKARLSVKEAVSIAIQVSMGIEAAHNNNIIHRDIKPQNIIISKEGKVKVTDFGIAKAATSNTITSNVMGSVHYTSPEQVRGGFSDEKSDIYSLGITLFEMLTGRVPFNGETTVAVAIKHIQEQMPSPREFVPEIPISVEQIVMKCTQKSPDRRYQSVPELIDDLKRSLISPDEDFVRIETDETDGVTKRISENEMANIKMQSKQRDSFDAQISRTDSMKKASEVVNEEAPVKKSVAVARELYNEPESYEEVYEEEYQDEVWEEEPYDQQVKKSSQNKKSNKTSSPKTSGNSKKNTNKSGNTKKNSSTKKYSKEDDYDPKQEVMTTIIVVVAAIIIGCVFLYIVGKALGINLFDGGALSTNTTSENGIIGNESFAMPMVDNLEADSVYLQLTALGLVVSKEYQESSEVSPNYIIYTSKPVGTLLHRGDEVTIFISSGNGASVATVPNVVGLTKAEATATLENDGYVVNVTKQNSDTVAKDVVISQTPDGNSDVPRGATIELVVSLGAEAVPVTMPNVVGQSETDAIIILAESGLNATVTKEEYSSSVEEGCITYQGYSAGTTVNTGTEVELHVSLGMEQVYYSCHMNVPAPSDYAGGSATVVLAGSDGTQLFATTTTNFPVEISVSNILGVETGMLAITYNVNQVQEVTDADGNVTTQNVQVQTQYGPEPVTFTRTE